MRTNIPSQLKPATIEMVQQTMLVATDQPSALYSCVTNKAEIDLFQSPNDSIGDTSFVRQLNELYNPVDIETDIPDIFVFTQFSAIPVADVVRGFHEAEGTTPPALAHVEASYWDSREYVREDPEFASWKILHQRFKAEVRRLEPIISGHDHVAVVDQYVSSGITIAYAGLVLYAAGAQRVTGMRGRWYENAPEKTVSVHGLTSDNAEQMQDIGRKACQVIYSLK